VLLALLAAPVAGCRAGDDTGQGVATATHTVARGDLTVEVSASGNLAFAREENLAFDMAGTVEDIFVKVGDSVSAGEVVATLDTADWERQLRSYQMSVLAARLSLKQADSALEEARSTTSTSITGDVVIKVCCDDDRIQIAEMQAEQAKMRLEDAQVSLDEHLAQSPKVVASFDGFVTRVGIEGGDTVMKGTVAATITDPDRFEVNILVSENDISQVTEGSLAQVTVDAMGITLPATVTDIAPTATISAGVVNYAVTIEVATLEEYAAQLSAASAANLATRDERPMGQGTVRSDQWTGAAGFNTGEPPNAGVPVVSLPAGASLRAGLSVTVTLIVAERSNVLLVPNSAISIAGGHAFVTVLAADGSEERREVTTGVSDWQYTEITAGLSEGDVVSYAGAANPTPSFPRGNTMVGISRPR